MVSVRVNGSDAPIPGTPSSSFGDLIELIKSGIDPEHMITSILLDGRELEDADWTKNLGQFGTSIIEIDTDTPERFVTARMACAGDVVKSIFLQFRDARQGFQNGGMFDGNQKLLRAVNTAKAFFEWYATMMELVPEGQKAKYDINDQVQVISDICKRVCQQQLYQSWWALGETLEKELEPKLDKLESFCSKFATAA
ncbi:MAG: hypothetical protein DCC75_00270 [Proteobacteria bacterium]|nr:MAG: hypothetical protein DCC75_00270 [Pseudomonadota bacterium]